MIYLYNDNELLYMMYECEDRALELLFHKYLGLIHRRLQLFRIQSKNYDDFFQECLMSFYDALNTYNGFYGKTFNRYFDLILQRRIMLVLRRERNYFYNVNIVEDLDSFVVEERPLFYVDDFSLTNLEKYVYTLRYKFNYSIEDITKILKCNSKKVYNIIFAIKQKAIVVLSEDEK